MQASERGLIYDIKQKIDQKRANTQPTWTEELIGPTWRANWEDQSYGLGSLIRRPERHNS